MNSTEKEIKKKYENLLSWKALYTSLGTFNAKGMQQCTDEINELEKLYPKLIKNG
jgi:hypothetical protein